MVCYTPVYFSCRAIGANLQKPHGKLPGVLEPGQRCQLLPGESSMTIEALQSATRQPMTLKEAWFRVVSVGVSMGYFFCSKNT